MTPSTDTIAGYILGCLTMIGTVACYGWLVDILRPPVRKTYPLPKREQK